MAVCYTVTGCATAELHVPSPAQREGQGQGEGDSERQRVSEAGGVTVNNHDVIVSAGRLSAADTVATRTYVNSLLLTQSIAVNSQR